MTITPPAAKLPDDDDEGRRSNFLVSHAKLGSFLDLMQVDPPPDRPGDEADVESEGGTIHRKSRRQTSKNAKVTPKLEHSPPSKAPVEGRKEEDEKSNEDDDDEDENGDEETFAVEKVLKHRIGKKQNVTRPCLHTPLTWGI